EGGTWRPLGVTADKVMKLVERIKDGAPALGGYAESLVNEAVARGYLLPPSAGHGSSMSKP
ncbi:MAG TPA: hypothetical protein VLL76_03265, partial [Candidatus Omnitrophota bacterium]|nr:hypothetical protein [Candidatus Omnitrophota bacterium]